MGSTKGAALPARPLLHTLFNPRGVPAGPWMTTRNDGVVVCRPSPAYESPLCRRARAAVLALRRRTQHRPPGPPRQSCDHGYLGRRASGIRPPAVPARGPASAPGSASGWATPGVLYGPLASPAFACPPSRGRRAFCAVLAVPALAGSSLRHHDLVVILVASAPTLLVSARFPRALRAIRLRIYSCPCRRWRPPRLTPIVVPPSWGHGPPT